MTKPAISAANNYPNLKKVIILKQIPCLDDKSSTPPGVKPKLSEMFNSNLDKLWTDCPIKKRVMIGNHNLDCTGGIREARYRNNVKHNIENSVLAYTPCRNKN